MRRTALASTMLLALGAGAHAADQVKLGFMTPLSGPISPAGTEAKRGTDLALEELGNKLGGLPVKYTVVDDKTNPAEAVQGASKLIDEAKVDFVTGFSGSNTMIPVWKTFSDAGVFAIGALAGPLQFAGKECVPNGFVASFSNDDWPAAVGKYMSDKGIKSAFFIGADYQAGYEHVGAAMKYFKGKAIGPVYTPLTQLDFAPEMARIRAEKPEAVFAFLVGAGGVALVKQYAQAGLQNQIPFYSEDPVANPLTFPAQGDAALGIVMSTNWTADLDNPANKKFVADFRAKHKTYPSAYGSQAYDAAALLDSGIKAVGGDLTRKEDMRKAMEKADFQSVRGAFKYGKNHVPIQSFYLQQAVKDGDEYVLKTGEIIVANDADKYSQKCDMK